VTTMAVHAHRGSPDPVAGIRENTLAAFARPAGWAQTASSWTSASRGRGPGGPSRSVVPGWEPSPTWPGRAPRARPAAREVLEACADFSVNIEIKNLPGEPGYDPGSAWRPRWPNW